MIILLIYNNKTQKFERYCSELYDPMPYTYKKHLTVKTFLSGSFSSIAWTTTEFLEGLIDLSDNFNENMRITRCFRRMCEGGHIAESQHYAGIAADFAYHIKPLQRLKMYYSLKCKNSFHYIDNIYRTRDYIHADARLGDTKRGYPELSLGEHGIYVLVLQDALNTIGITGSALDGFFGSLTFDCVKRFQEKNNLDNSGYVDKKTWRYLTHAATSVGVNSTVLHMN